MKSYSVRDEAKIDHIAGKTIYPMTLYPSPVLERASGFPLPRSLASTSVLKMEALRAEVPELVNITLNTTSTLDSASDPSISLSLCTIVSLATIIGISQDMSDTSVQCKFIVEGCRNSLTIEQLSRCVAK